MNRDRQQFSEHALAGDGLVEFSVCSSEPVKRYDEWGQEYQEVLVIGANSVDFSRLSSGSCPFLWGHDQDKVLGVIEKAWIDGEKVRVLVRFSKNGFAQERLQDVLDGITTCTSIGYEIQEFHREKGVVYVDRFSVYEASLVSVPADPTTGYNRASKSVNCNRASNSQCNGLIEIEDNAMKDEGLIEDKKEDSIDASNTNTEEFSEEEKKEQEHIEEQGSGEIQQAIDTATEEGIPATVEGEVADGGATAPESNGDDGESPALVENPNENEVESSDTGSKDDDTVIEESQEILKHEERTMMKFSIRKAILNATTRGHFDPQSTEARAMDELRSRYGLNEADVIIENTRAIDGSEALNQTQYRPDLYAGALRPQSVIARTGATYVPVEGPSISFAVADKGCAGGFVDLNGEIPAADCTFVQKTLTPKKFGAYCELSYKALLQDRPEIETVITEDILKAVDEIRDKALIAGSGTGNEPAGILNTEGINTVAIPAGGFTLETAYAFEKPIRDANIFSDNLKWVMSSDMFYKLATTPKSSTALNEFLISEDRKMIGYEVIVDNHLGANGILLGDFSEAIVADFEPISLKVVEDAGLSRKQAVEVQSFGAVDVCVRRPKAFTKGA